MSVTSAAFTSLSFNIQLELSLSNDLHTIFDELFNDGRAQSASMLERLRAPLM